MREMPESRFYSHGKLLITGEYLVLDGAHALAVPTRRGQSLVVQPKGQTEAPTLFWTSSGPDGASWFEGRFSLPDGRLFSGTDPAVGARLQQLLQAGQRLRPDLWAQYPAQDLQVATHLEFPRNWGLGSSSTLVANLASWWRVDPYQLLAKTFGGSGYDLACAHAEGPIYYFLPENAAPIVSTAAFDPPFAGQLYFLFLEQKQDSRSGIARYRARGRPDQGILAAVSAIGEEITATDQVREFCRLLEQHERIIAELIDLAPVKERLFPDFPGAIKSLGAWGGDFVLVASELPPAEVQAYFSSKAFPTLIPYREMVFSR